MKHKDRCPCCKRGSELEREVQRMREALEKIAHPALGGKEQQWLAQQCLACLKERDLRT